MDCGSKRRRIAFYAPLKQLDHPTPSGDRVMARLLMKALDIIGYDIVIASDIRSFSREPNDAVLAENQAKAAVAREDLLERFARDGRPAAWLTYHPYYKSPDLLGPFIARTLDIPYVTVEASHAPKRNRDRWQPWQALTEQALLQGAAHFCMTRRDRLGLAAFLGSEKRLIDLPPFLDTTDFASTPSLPPDSGPIRLVTVAMMRPDNKLESYRFLAEALESDPSLPDWHLTIIGDGPARSEVTAAFSCLDPARLAWHGMIEAVDVRAALLKADLFVWPGCDEAYGMAYLEAQALGLPVLALDSGAVAEVVRNGETGILVQPGPPGAFVTALRTMIDDRPELARKGQAARRFVHEERNLDRAAAILSAGIEKVLG